MEDCNGCSILRKERKWVVAEGCAGRRVTRGPGSAESRDGKREIKL